MRDEGGFAVGSVLALVAAIASRSNREDLYREALEAAFEQAKAEQLAAKIGVTLGRPIDVVEARDAAGSYVVAEAAGAALDVEPGESEILATLEVTFAIS